GSAAVRGDAFSSCAARPQRRTQRLLLRAALSRAVRPRARVSAVSAVLVLAAYRRAGVRGHLARLPRRPVAAARGGAVEPCHGSRLGAPVSAPPQRLGR